MTEKGTRIVILLGAPGAGKGTLAGKLCEAKPQIRTVSTGQLLREEVAKGSELGNKVSDILKSGKLVDDELMIAVVDAYLGAMDRKDVACLLLDGFPRTVPQAEALDKLIEKYGIEVGGALHLDIPEELILQRLTGRRVCEKCGAIYNIYFDESAKTGQCEKCSGKLVIRSDDEPETVRKRLEVYAAQTQPLIDYYREQGKLLVLPVSNDLNDNVKNALSLLEGLS
ncbi:MAG: adenylate kinase [Lentisphaerae bacterium]|nr:MAG: adenylate kinase [Lentisphaerota bacterium]